VPWKTYPYNFKKIYVIIKQNNSFLTSISIIILNFGISQLSKKGWKKYLQQKLEWDRCTHTFYYFVC
jgi:hypothetical protein